MSKKPKPKANSKATIRQVRTNKLTPEELDFVVSGHPEHVEINFPGSVMRPEFGDQLVEGLKKDGAYYFFARRGNKILGFISLLVCTDPYKDPSPFKYVDVRYIQVAPETRGQGIGRKLMEKIKWVADKHGCKEQRLGTGAGNAAAIALYESFGFKIYTVVMRGKIGS